jgi:hypothetical protein
MYTDVFAITQRGCDSTEVDEVKKMMQIEDEEKAINYVIDDFDNQMLVRTMRSRMFQKAYEMYLIEKGTFNEVDRYCTLHAKVAVVSNGKLICFEQMLPPLRWKKVDK